MRIGFVVSEVEDLVKTGGLADVGKALPIALTEMGHDVRIVMPMYQAIADHHRLSDACVSLNFAVEERQYQFAVKQLELHGVTVYLIDHAEFFQRAGLYSDGYDAYTDNGERFGFLANAALHAFSHVGFIPEVIHCNDWHTALLPFFIRYNPDNNINQEFAATRTVLTIHNAAFQGVFERSSVHMLAGNTAIEHFNHSEYVNFLQTGLQCCDGITSVSPNYAKELLTDLGSHGLSHILRRRQDRLYGVLNGCDYSQWDPQTDIHIKHHFNSQDMSGKKACKMALQRFAKLPKAAKIPIIGMVCRLTEQKGFGYIMPILERLLQHNVQLVIVGTGDPVVVEQLRHISAQFANKFSFIEGFSNEYAHWIEAGSDFFLMPSQFEPCGLNQMYSLAYGTLPIVRGVGGLKDTVIDLEQQPEQATGFVFLPPQPQALLDCIRRALLTYHESPEELAKMQQRAMQTKFTWSQAAAKYAEVYQQIL
ncbi:glycogen synthase GlgA [Alteromonas sp. ASW11-36]|uniref:Glycogen synthase n=1 Tax=Alteromonas arenosi TaxID=3055817 RepID=A0ABT7SSF4_9ALTE|nr:glycogen synthase GlgA [Alteromonas sp. ASW11-36]MDM7859117.1 glycogen synthase GlgA [Alteromonas sp. ASW11-36]